MNARCLPLALLTGYSLASAAPPESPKKPVTDVYHGVTVVDDFRWLEDGDNAAVKAWSDAQNADARAVAGQTARHRAVAREARSDYRGKVYHAQ